VSEQTGKRNGLSRNGSNGHSNGHSDQKILITGGAGFIGTNVAERLLSAGHRVVVLDNFSRTGVEQNAVWLQHRYGDRVRVLVGDVRKRDDIKRAVAGVSHVFHFAAQVAVTTSMVDPRTDFEVNTGGTVNLLEELRTAASPPSIVYTSTNKVYGGLDDVCLKPLARRYAPLDNDIASRGVSEMRPLDFHTPYGCSKGAAEQYVLDYGRSFNVPAVVFRMSCIYGPHQFGTEDQGWVAHFLIRAIENKAITLYGDGMQVRDILFVDDLVNAFLLAWKHIHELSGQAFNVGGGPDRTISLLELVDLITTIHGCRPKLGFEASRAGDQRYYVTDSAKFRAATGWSPAVSAREGVARLYEWLQQSRKLAPSEIVAS
jgi:CDP-paratose 2-epimerase